MKVCGIIVEYNPFHNGHIHHIEQTRVKTKCDLLIAIMSPTFMQRGEPAIINKFIRTKFALDYGIDLVIELPSIYAIQSANHFAAGALKLLNELGVNQLVFGSESNDLSSLIINAKTSLTKEYQELVKKYLKDGQRYAIACNNAFKHFDNTTIKEANDILGLSYLQEIFKHNYNIKPYSIKRTNDYLDNKIHSSIASATAIRNALQNNNDISNTTPLANLLINSDELVYLDDFFEMLKYQLTILSNTSIKKIHGFDEGLEFLFKNKIEQAKNINDFINLVSSKRYPKTRIQRAIICLLCNITKDDINNITVDYIRVLGMNNKGQQYLKEAKNKTKYKIITRFSSHKTLALDLEYRVTSVYSLTKQQVNYLQKKEYQQPVIRK